MIRTIDRLVLWYVRHQRLRHRRWLLKNRVLIMSKPERGTVIGNWGRL